MKKEYFSHQMAGIFLLFVAGTGYVFAQNPDYQNEVQSALDNAQNQQNTPDNPFPPSYPAGSFQNPSSSGQPTPFNPYQPGVSPNDQPASGGQPVGVIKMQSEASASQNNPLIDVLELKDIDITDVLKLISKKSGFNIVAGKDVRGKVTIYLKDVGLYEALHIILESNSFAYVEKDNMINVMTARDYEAAYGQKFGEKTRVKIVQLKYANAADVLALLNQLKSTIGKVIADDKSNTLVLTDVSGKLATMEMFLKEIDVPIKTVVFDISYALAEDLSKKVSEALTKNVGTVKFDQRSNKIIVTDTPAKLEEIEKMIKAFDEQHQEVLIEAKIIQIVLSDQYRMGVDWQAVVSNYRSLDLKSTFNILNAGDKKGRLSIGTIAKDDYTALIEALDTVGKTNILSSPHITVINNKEAKILVGSTEPYVTTTTTTPATGPTTTAESVNFIDVGVKLYVTPTIHKDNFITMKIKPEVSSVISTLTTGQNNKIPVVATSEAETTVMAKDGVTIVIGGLIKDEKVDSVNKIPILGDLPLVGAVFRNKDRLSRKTELVIFLTPKIITGDVSTSKGPERIHDDLERKTTHVFDGL